MSTISRQQLRLRVFAGPNGSGKSTVIEYVRNYKVSGRSIDFGYYINADEIAIQLKEGKFQLSTFNITSSRKEFINIAVNSGLIREEYPLKVFEDSFSYGTDHSIKLKKNGSDERLAQIIADSFERNCLKKRSGFHLKQCFLTQVSWMLCGRRKKRDIKYISILSQQKILLSISFG